MKANTRSESNSHETIARRQIEVAAEILEDAEGVRARVHQGWLGLAVFYHDNACGVGMRIPVGQDLHSDETYTLADGSAFAAIVGDGDGEISLTAGELEIATESGTVQFDTSTGGYPAILADYGADEPATFTTTRREEVVALFSSLPSGDAYRLIADEGTFTVESWQASSMIDSHEVTVSSSVEATSAYTQSACASALSTLPDTDAYRFYVFDDRPLAVSWVDGSVFGRHLVAPCVGDPADGGDDR